MKYCDEFAALLDPYIDGELPPEETARVREHLRACGGCRAYVQAALVMRDAFPEAESAEVPDGFAEGVMAAIRANAAPRKRRSPRWQKTLLPLAVCCAVVVLAVSSLPRPSDTAVEADVAARTERQVPSNAADPAAGNTTEDSATEDSTAQTEEDPDSADVASNAPAATAGAAPETYATAPAAQGESEPDADPKASIALQGKTAVEETEEPAAPEAYAVQTAPALTLTAEEAGTLLDGYTPTTREDGTLAYELTASAYAALLEQLEQQGMTVAGAATAQEAEAAETVWVYVIPE